MWKGCAWRELEPICYCLLVRSHVCRGELSTRSLHTCRGWRPASAAAGDLRQWGRRRPQMKYHLSPPPSTHRRCAAAGIELEDCSPLPLRPHTHTRASRTHARPFGLRIAAAAVAQQLGAMLGLPTAHAALLVALRRNLVPSRGRLCARRPGVVARDVRALRAMRAAPRQLQAGWSRPSGGPRSHRGQSRRQ